MRQSIGAKIFGVSLFLLVLMVLVAATASYLARDEADELSTIAYRNIPLKDAVTDVEINLLRQEDHFDTLLGLLRAARPDETAIARERMALIALDALVEGDISRVRADIRQPGLIDEEDKIAMERFDGRLSLLHKEHRDFHEVAIRIVDLIANGRPEAVPELELLLAKEREDLDRDIDSFIADIRQFSLRSVETARADANRLMMLVLAVTIIAVLVGLLISAYVVRGLVRPVRALVAGTRAVEHGDLDLVLAVHTDDEVGQLTTAFNRMVRELKVKERIKETFGRYVDPRIVADLIERPEAVGAGGDRRVMSVFFCDIKGFTGMSEGLTPTGLVNLLNRYFTLMSEPVRRQGGIIDKFIGDAIMAFWGPPFVGADEHAAKACFAAIDFVKTLAVFRGEMPELMGIKRGLPEIDIRIGIASGDVIIGNIGSDTSRSYTVMGDTVNLASRLEAVNKVYGTRILVAEETAKQAGDSIETREIDSIAVFGRNETVRIFEIVGRKGTLDDDTVQLRQRFEAGLAAYRRREWNQAEAAFSACRAIAPNDGPATVFLDRVKRLQANPPSPDWDGVWRLSEK